MTILSVHHWDEEQERGVRELRRVSSDTVVIMTYDASVSCQMWLMADYLRGDGRDPRVGRLRRRRWSAVTQLGALRRVCWAGLCQVTARE